MIDDNDPLGPLDPDFAAQFNRDDRRPACQLYLISPLDVSAVEMHAYSVQPRSQTARPLGGTVYCRSPGQLPSDGLMLMTRTQPSAVVGASTARERRAAASMSGALLAASKRCEPSEEQL